MDIPAAPSPAPAAPRPRDRAAQDKIRCDACPVMCYIAPGQAGACDRYANEGGALVRLDPLVVLDRAGAVVPFLDTPWEGRSPGAQQFVTAIGAGTTYPDYKPAPFIVATGTTDADLVTVVTEGIFSYCGAKVKIDTDRPLGPECAPVRAGGEVIGHITTAEYGSQMLSLGGVVHLTGGSKSEGRATCAALEALCNREEVELSIDDGPRLRLAAGRAPVIDGQPETRMRVGCGSATVGMFAAQWQGLVDEVVVVDDHITGVMSEHQAGKVLGWPATGIRIRGHRSTPGRYFKVARPGTGWGGTDLTDPLTILGPWNARIAWPGLRLLMVSTTGAHAGYFVLDPALCPVETEMPADLAATVARIAENCEPALSSVLFMAGAGGSLRSGVTENPIGLTRAVQQGRVRITAGGAPVLLWPGGGITYMVDVTQMPRGAFGSVPTPALVAPIEFTLRRADYAAMGGHLDHVLSLGQVLAGVTGRQCDHRLAGLDTQAVLPGLPWPGRLP